jgi:hypothetical protein
VAFGPVVAHARVLVHGAARAEGLAERRRAHSANHAGLEVEEHRARHLLAARGLVIKRAGAVELRVIVAAVLAVAADAVLVSHHLQKLGSHLATALARLHV